MDVCAIEWEEKKEVLREERKPVVRITAKCTRRAMQAATIQSLSGEYFIWENPAGPQDIQIAERMKAIDAGQVKVEERRLWTNSEAIGRRKGEETVAGIASR